MGGRGKGSASNPDLGESSTSTQAAPVWLLVQARTAGLWNGKLGHKATCCPISTPKSRLESFSSFLKFIPEEMEMTSQARGQVHGAHEYQP